MFLMFSMALDAIRRYFMAQKEIWIMFLKTRGQIMDEEHKSGINEGKKRAKMAGKQRIELTKCG